MRLEALLAIAAAAVAQETCTVVDQSNFVVQCPQSGYFTFATMGSGYVSMDYTPSGGQDTWVFFFEMIGALPSTVTDPTTQISCAVPAGTVMAQYTTGGCYNLGQASQAVFTYHSNAGDGSYMDIKFLGGDGGRSSEITYYCNRQGTGISSFQYDYESPTKNYQASIQGVEPCQGSPSPPFASTTPVPTTIEPVDNGDWDCINGSCVSNTSQQGKYVSYATCRASCIPPNAPMWVPPAAYITDATVALPRSGILETVRVAYDGPQYRSRFDFYGGKSVSIYRGDVYPFGNFFTITPVLNNRSCFLETGSRNSPILAMGLLPDLTEYSKLPTPQAIDGVLCDVYQFNYTESLGNSSAAINNSYTFFVNHATQTPFAFYFIGFDSLFGSHYDEYVIKYQTWTPNPTLNLSIFNPPASPTCQPFVGSAGVSAKMQHHLYYAVAEPRASVKYALRAYESFPSVISTKSRETSSRLGIFIQNHIMLGMKTRQGLGFSIAESRFFDWSQEELKRKFHSGAVISKQQQMHSSGAIVQLMNSFDLRATGAIGPVLDEGICSGGWALAAAAAVSGVSYLRQCALNTTACTSPPIPFSAQLLVDCTWSTNNMGCSGGTPQNAFDWFMLAKNKANQFVTEMAYGPYLMSSDYCRAGTLEDPEGVLLQGYNVFNGNVTAIQEALLMNGPVTAMMDASQEDFLYYSGGVYYNAACSSAPSMLSHSVLLIGWGLDASTGPFWILQSTWGSAWGENGYARVSMKNNNCGLASAATQPVLA